MPNKSWNSVWWPWCAHTKSPIFPLEVEWQMFHTCADRWKHKVRYLSCMHLHICFKIFVFPMCQYKYSRKQQQSFSRIFHARGLRATGDCREIQNRAQEQVPVASMLSDHKLHTPNTETQIICVWSSAPVRTHRAHTSCTGSEIRREQYEIDVITSTAEAMRTIPFSLCTGGQ